MSEAKAQRVVAGQPTGALLVAFIAAVLLSRPLLVVDGLFVSSSCVVALLLLLRSKSNRSLQRLFMDDTSSTALCSVVASRFRTHVGKALWIGSVGALPSLVVGGVDRKPANWFGLYPSHDTMIQMRGV